MKNVKLKNKRLDTIQISELITATSIVSGRSIEDVTTMVYEDRIHPSQSRFYTLSLQKSYWRQGDWFDDALKHLLICNLKTALIIVEDKE